jgi:4-hydroxybenzoate polyprenyltransferase
MQYLKIMRPTHWTKNTFVFAALVFGGKLAGPAHEVMLAAASAVGGFACFCLAASSIYIFNDVVDRRLDRIHPTKRDRPIASGSVGVAEAVAFSVFCGVLAMVAAAFLASSLAVVIAAYMALMILYSLVLKKLLILDCLVISVGFCLRAVAGAVVVGVAVSPWMIVCTFALCLFLGFGKRRSEIAQLGPDGNAFRETLAGYTNELLGHMLDVTSGLAVVCFLLYATDERTVSTFGTRNLVYTTPLVLYCVFRFSALIATGRYSGPVQIVLTDRPFQTGLILWIACCGAIIYADLLMPVFGNVWAY